MLYFRYNEKQARLERPNAIIENGLNIPYTEMCFDEVPNRWKVEEIVFKTDKKSVLIRLPNGNTVKTFEK